MLDVAAQIRSILILSLSISCIKNVINKKYKKNLIKNVTTYLIGLNNSYVKFQPSLTFPYGRLYYAQFSSSWKH